MRLQRALLLILASAVSACGADGTDGASAPDEPAATAPSTGGEGDDVTSGAPDITEDETAFPVTVDHKFGATEISEEPERIVALGYTELDYVLALGLTPVGARYPQFGDETTAVRPWAEDDLTGDDPEVLNFAFGELGFEAVAALDPDLILAVTAGITEDEYDTLTAIAPTVAQTDEFVDFGMPWEDTMALVGEALGRADDAADLVADVEADFAAARQAVPELEGLTVASAFYGVDEILFFASEDLRARFFTSLDMVVPPELDEIAGDEFFGTLSQEQIGLVDTDVLVWSQLQFTDGGREAIEADPLVQQLTATREGRALYVGGEVDDALQVSTVLSLPSALDGIVPMLERAADGDPATVPSP